MEVRLQAIVGRQVHDIEGNVAGRIGEVIAERVGADCHVVEYHLGPAAFLSRLGITAGRMIGVTRRGGPLRVPWHQLDLSDPKHLRLRCRLSELSAVGPHHP